MKSLLGSHLLEAHEKRRGAFSVLLAPLDLEDFTSSYAIDWAALALLFHSCFVLAPKDEPSAKTQLMLLLDGGTRIISEDDLWHYTSLMMDRRKLAWGKAASCNSPYDLCVLGMLKTGRTVNAIVKQRNYRVKESKFSVETTSDGFKYGLHIEGYAVQRTNLVAEEHGYMPSTYRNVPWFDEFVHLLVDAHVANIKGLWLTVQLPIWDFNDTDTAKALYAALKQVIDITWINRFGVGGSNTEDGCAASPSWVAALRYIDGSLGTSVAVHNRTSGHCLLESSAPVSILSRTNVTVVFTHDAPELLRTNTDSQSRETSNAAYIDATLTNKAADLDALGWSGMAIHRLAVNRLNQYLHMPEEEARAMAQYCVKGFMRKYGVAPLTHDSFVDAQKQSTPAT